MFVGLMNRKEGPKWIGYTFSKPKTFNSYT